MVFGGNYVNILSPLDPSTSCEAVTPSITGFGKIPGVERSVGGIVGGTVFVCGGTWTKEQSDTTNLKNAEYNQFCFAWNAEESVWQSVWVWQTTDATYRRNPSSVIYDGKMQFLGGYNNVGGGYNNDLRQFELIKVANMDYQGQTTLDDKEWNVVKAETCSVLFDKSR